MNLDEKVNKKPLRIGHRGACGYESENTMSSFQKALELGVDIMECDVRLTADNELVVMHDSRVNRTTDGKGKLKTKTLETLFYLNTKNGEKVPLLIDVMNLCVGKAQINIEFKDSRLAYILAKFLKKQIIEKKWNVEDIYVSSFVWKALVIFHREARMFKIGVLVNRNPFFIRTAVATNAYSVNLPLYFTYKPIVKFIQFLQWKVFVYTVNEPEDIKRMKQIGVDGIFSNFPDRI